MAVNRDEALGLLGLLSVVQHNLGLAEKGLVDVAMGRPLKLQAIMRIIPAHAALHELEEAAQAAAED